MDVSSVRKLYTGQFDTSQFVNLTFSFTHNESSHLPCSAPSRHRWQHRVIALSQIQAGIWGGHAVSSSKKQSVGYINNPELVWCFQLEGEKGLQTVWHVALCINRSPASQALVIHASCKQQNRISRCWQYQRILTADWRRMLVCASCRWNCK